MAELDVSKKEIIQLKNISETLIEATEHFTKYIKDRNTTQSINIFSAVVEGFQSIQRFFIAYQIELDDQLITKTEKDLILIAQQLEDNDILKISQVIQFSLMPKFRQLYALFTPEETNKKTVIRSEEHTSELQSRGHLVCRLLLEKKKLSAK